MTDAQVLIRAARLIEKYGLAKGERLAPDGRMCVHGAIAMALVGDPKMAPMRETRITQRVFGSFGIAPWNNAPDTTQDEVIALLESGAYSLGAAGGAT